MITWQYTRAAGRAYQPTLLLTTIGQRTGLLRSSALPFFQVGDDLVVCGTRGGGPNDPLWVSNVQADPHRWLRVRRRLVTAAARVATGEERVELFEAVVAEHGGLRRYQKQAATYGREIPLVVLTPAVVPPPNRPPGQRILVDGLAKGYNWAVPQWVALPATRPGSGEHAELALGGAAVRVGNATMDTSSRATVPVCC